MANNKVQLANGTVLIDLTDATATADKILSGYTAYGADGSKITGTAVSFAVVTSEEDAAGGDVVHISTTDVLDLSQDTVTAETLLSGYTAHDRTGQAIVGTATGGSAVLGTKTITENGTYSAANDELDGYSSVTVNVPSVEPVLQAKTHVAPTESSQTITPDNGYDALSSVQIDAVSSSYVGSAVDRRSSSDLTASGATVSVPAGYYAESASKSVTSGSAATPATTITANPSISVSAAGLITATASASKSVTPSVSAGYISSGTAGTVSVSGSNTQQLSTQGAATITPTKSQQTAVASNRYTTGAVVVAPIPAAYQDVTGVTATAADVVSGKDIVDSSGTVLHGSLVIQHYYTGSSAPSSSLGADGDIYLQTGA